MRIYSNGPLLFILSFRLLLLSNCLMIKCLQCIANLQARRDHPLTSLLITSEIVNVAFVFAMLRSLTVHRWKIAAHKAEAVYRGRRWWPIRWCSSVLKEPLIVPQQGLWGILRCRKTDLWLWCAFCNDLMGILGSHDFQSILDAFLSYTLPEEGSSNSI